MDESIVKQPSIVTQAQEIATKTTSAQVTIAGTPQDVSVRGEVSVSAKRWSVGAVGEWVRKKGYQFGAFVGWNVK